MPLVQVIKKTLEARCEHFEQAAVDSIQTVLGLPVTIYRKFEVFPHISNEYSMSSNIQASNEFYQSLLSLGVNVSDLPELIYGEIDHDMQIDAVGEITNVLIGALMDDEFFLNRFGFMEPSPPFFSEGGKTFQKTWGIQGTLLVGDVKMLFAFSIWPVASQS